MVREQADIERPSVQVRSRERLEPLAQRGPGDAERVDRIGLARSLAERRAPAMCLGATRTIRSPRATRKRSNAPDTCRQSSIAQTRSGSSARAQRKSLPKLPLRAGAVSSPRALAVSASTAPQVWVFLCVSVPITIMCTVPSIDELTKRTPADTSHSGPMPSSYQVTPVVPGGDGRHNIRRSHQPVDRKSMSQPAAGPRTNRGGRTSPPRPERL